MARTKEQVHLTDDGEVSVELASELKLRQTDEHYAKALEKLKEICIAYQINRVHLKAKSREFYGEILFAAVLFLIGYQLYLLTTAGSLLRSEADVLITVGGITVVIASLLTGSAIATYSERDKYLNKKRQSTAVIEDLASPEVLNLDQARDFNPSYLVDLMVNHKSAEDIINSENEKNKRSRRSRLQSDLNLTETAGSGETLDEVLADQSPKQKNEE